MTDSQDGPHLDPLIHELPRLRICAVLAATNAVESQTLKQITDLSDSALSKHIKRLVDAGYLQQQPGASGGLGRPRTWVSLTELGSRAYEQHLEALRHLTAQP
ncbi:transcriptional regulator [Yaniella flava]|uniref:Transcriptional regulator n=1 Tax=Yaniella flava TaxID=287930 RepID=A0ABP5G2W4_9MICC|nr:transcriptional regulator [Micrococcaceae bacterium]